jgi:dihydrodipicolinate synthase/N-acetylneuraminate lyase
MAAALFTGACVALVTLFDDDDGAARLVGADAGAAAVLALSPPHADDVRPHYEALAALAGDLGVLALSLPRRLAAGHRGRGPGRGADAGVKDSSGDAGRLVAELGAYDGPLYVGSSAYLAPAGPLGATGAILSLANTDPEGCIAALAGDMEAPAGAAARPSRVARRLTRRPQAAAGAHAGTPAAVRAN